MDIKLTDEKPKTIYQRLSDFREEVGSLTKDGKNPAFKSRYATLAGILEAVNPVLRAHGLVFYQAPCAAPDGVAALRTVIVTLDGKEEIEGRAEMRPADTKPQTYVSCLTYLRRTGLEALIGLPTEDDDGNAASGTPTKTEANPF
jgi:hypothetical protein